METRTHMDYKDYYAILGVPKSADAKAIKKAYRELARKYHPDVNKSPEAEQEFKEINEANEVLSDPEKRKKYDQLGRSYQEWERMGGRPGGFDWSQWMSGQPGGTRVEYGDLGGFSDFFEAIFGGTGFSGPGGSVEYMDLNDLLRGRGARGGRQRTTHGQDYDAQVDITLEEAYHGTTRLVSKDGRRLQVKIPRGAKAGTKVRLAGEGGAGAGGAEAGDLYLIVSVREDPRFERDGDDLYADIMVDLYTAILGGEVQVPTMTGNVTMKAPAGTQPGRVIRLRGRGMPVLKHKDTYGDLYVRVNVELPSDLSPEEQDLFERLANLRSYR